MSRITFDEELQTEKIEQLINELDSSENNFEKIKSFISRNKKEITEIDLFTSIKLFIHTLYSSDTTRRVENGELFIMSCKDLGFSLKPVVESLDTKMEIQLLMFRSKDDTYKREVPISYYTGLNFYESSYYEKRFKGNQFDFDEKNAIIKFQKENIRKFTTNKFLLDETRAYLEQAKEKSEKANEKAE